MSLTDRLWKKIQPEPNTGCWIWMASTVGKGQREYGLFYFEGRMRLAHRISYQIYKGPIPKGLEIDHLCRVPLCVNPDHLEAVTHQENCRRGHAGKHLADKTHCPQGHPYSGDNLRIDKKGGRICVTCDRANKLRWYYDNKGNQELPQ